MRYEGEQKSHRPAQCKCSDCALLSDVPHPRGMFYFVLFRGVLVRGSVVSVLFLFGISPSATAAAAVFWYKGHPHSTRHRSISASSSWCTRFKCVGVAGPPKRCCKYKNVHGKEGRKLEKICGSRRGCEVQECRGRSFEVNQTNAHTHPPFSLRTPKWMPSTGSGAAPRSARHPSSW